MNKFSVNLSTIFTEVPFLQRFKKAREHGFTFVECQFPYAYSIEDIQCELDQNELSMMLINLPAGNWEKGDRGLAADPDRTQEFRESVQKGIKYATALNIPMIHCMAGKASDLDAQTTRKAYEKNLRYAGTEMAKHHLTLLIEPINPFDMPDYYLNNLYQAKKILDVVNLPNVKLQFDFYHMERVHGKSLTIYKEYAEMIGHIQIADVPGRHEPGTGNMDYQRILEYLDKNYDGTIGLEYSPSGKSEESFAWLKKGEELA